MTYMIEASAPKPNQREALMMKIGSLNLDLESLESVTSIMDLQAITDRLHQEITGLQTYILGLNYRSREVVHGIGRIRYGMLGDRKLKMMIDSINSWVETLNGPNRHDLKRKI